MSYTEYVLLPGSDEARASVRLVTCPTCGAGSGQGCTGDHHHAQRGTQPRDGANHIARIRLYHRLIKAGQTRHVA